MAANNAEAMQALCSIKISSVSKGDRSIAKIAFIGCFRLLILTLLTLVSQAQARGAEDLSLRPGLSFNQDIDNGFPIVGNKLDDTSFDNLKPTFIFFAASGDLNANRQAKRVVDIYHKLAPNSVKFIIIDVDHPSDERGRTLIKDFYKGYIPAQVLLDRRGKLIWQRAGEADLSEIKAQIDKSS